MLNMSGFLNHVNFKNGIPSEWTFRRLFTLLNPNTLEELLRDHAALILKEKASNHIAVDGKALRGSKRKDLKCLQSLTAWSVENKLVIAEQQVEGKSNEIKAIPILLDSLDLKGKTISIDAAGCQKAIASQIKNKQGHYVLGLKRNHPNLYNKAIELCLKIGESDKNRLEDHFDSSHGRRIRRRYFGYDAKNIVGIDDWSGAKSIIAALTISSKNNCKDLSKAEWRYYLSSHKHNNKELPKYIRNHWGIENSLHWILDVHFKEDDDQKAERNSARCFALLRRIAMNIVRIKDTTPKRSVRRKLKRSGWDNDYLHGLLVN